nr:salivary acidic proline-rich phosphoprotein 1/2-like [Ziziphus jujuba var. spinosa]
MVQQMPQGHFMGMNPMHGGSSAGAPPQVGGFPNGMQNMQGPSKTGGPPMYPQGGAFNRGQAGQMPMMPGYNHYQSTNQSGMPQPPPPGPPHGQLPQ